MSPRTTSHCLLTITTAAILVAPAAFAQHKLRQGQLSAVTAKIDSLVQNECAKQGVRVHDVVDDETFLRRTYLNVVGRIPNLKEATAFLDSNKPSKRRELIDELLLSKGRKSHMFHYWADVLRAKTRLAQQTSGAPYMKFIKDSIEANKPYDEFVREMLTAEGAAHAPGNGATGYYMRDRGMPEDNMANTVRIFLGTRLECAQCHNHPFDKWTQQQFFKMAAFTGGIQYRQNLRQSEFGSKVRDMQRSIRSMGQDGTRAFRRMIRGALSGVHGSGTGIAQLPKDYQYDDAKPRDLVKADTMFGPDVDLEVNMPDVEKLRRRAKRQRRRRPTPIRLEEVDSREVYAEWLTSPDNPRFTTVIANRLWKRVMGRGLIEPVDDMKDDTVASNPRLMEYLEELMVELDYDLREFERVLLNTKVAQRATPKKQPASDEVWHFPGPLMRRMTAEQMWDSMLTFVLYDVDTTIDQNDPSKVVFEQYERFLAMDDKQLKDQVQLQMLRSTDPDEYRRQVRQRRNKMRNQQKAKFADARKRARPIIKQIQRARRDGDMKREEQLLAKLDEMGLLEALRKANRNLVRASELQSPAPEGHFLREFGQSDREQIEGSTDAPTVPQALTMLNGFIERYVLRQKDSPLAHGIHRAKGSTAKVRTAYLAILGRKPTSRELSMWRSDLDKLGAEGCQDLVWTLVNSHEFRFVQ